MATLEVPNIRKRATLRDRESGEVFRVASIGKRYVRYRAIRGSGRGVVLRESLDEVFEVSDPVPAESDTCRR